MAAANNDSDDEIVAINVTPLVDITLVLLIIFMVTANFITRETKEVELPKANKGGQTIEGALNVVVDKDGKVFLDGVETDEAGLKAKVVEVAAKEKEPRALITADTSLNYGRVMRVIDIVQLNGVTRFALTIVKEAAAAPAP
jgi:biopolymer transport protein TolR